CKNIPEYTTHHPHAKWWWCKYVAAAGGNISTHSTQEITTKPTLRKSPLVGLAQRRTFACARSGAIAPNTSTTEKRAFAIFPIYTTHHVPDGGKISTSFDSPKNINTAS
ncbi:unnamed protein product, partial [Ectocarpus sp. 8 AP-2014]